MEKIPSQMGPAALFRPKERRRIKTRLSPNGCLPYRQKGEYAVYVSYRACYSVSDAKYLVFHNGGVTNQSEQKIGGGTWVYLGTFEFDKANNDYGMVVLSNESSEHGVVCADAVRFGGGMGNIERGGKTSRICPVIWKGHATLPNGRECHTRYMRGGKVKMIMRMTSIHAPTQLIIYPEVLSIIRNNPV